MRSSRLLVPYSVNILLCLNGYAVARAIDAWHTDNGYDNEYGTDPICWVSGGHSNASIADDLNSISELEIGRFDSPDMLSNCPSGTAIYVDPPTTEAFLTDDHLLTGKVYLYRFFGKVRLSDWRQLVGLPDSFHFSEKGTKICAKVSFCDIRYVGFCTPFVFERLDDSPSLEHDHEHEHEHEHEHNGENDDEHVPHSGNEDDHGNVRKHDHEHIESECIDIDFDPSEEEFEFGIDIPVTAKVPGYYFPIGYMQMLLTNFTTISGTRTAEQNSISTYKVDVSSALEQRIVFFEDPPYISAVKVGVKHASYVIIAAAAAVELGLLIAVVKHRKSKVMRLSQGYFLVILLVAALIPTVFCFIVDPKTKLYCNLQGPLLFIPIQFIYAIIIGRLWRINTIMSPLMSWGKHPGKIGRSRKASTIIPEWIAKKSSSSRRSSSNSAVSEEDSAKPHSTERMERHQRRSIHRQRRPSQFKRTTTNLRQKITTLRVSMVIFFITLPQVVLQVILLIFFPQDIHLATNINRTKGKFRCHCPLESYAGHSVTMLSTYAVTCFTIVALLAMAYRARELPFLFNEAQHIFTSVLVVAMIFCVGGVLIFATDSPSSSPDVAYITRVVFILSQTINVSLKIVLPKLKIIWSGEQIVVSDMVNSGRRSSNIGMPSSQNSGPNSQTSRTAFTKKIPTFTLPKISRVSRIIKDDNDDDTLKEPKKEPNDVIVNGCCDISAEANGEMANGKSNGSTKHLFQGSKDPEDVILSDDLNIKEDVTLSDGPNIKEDVTLSNDPNIKEERFYDAVSGIASKEPPVAFASSADDSQDHHIENGKYDMNVSKRKLSNVAESNIEDGQIEKENYVDGQKTKVSFDISSSGTRKRRSRKTYIIKENVLPPKKIIVDIMEATTLYTAVNHRLLSGLMVKRDDWESVREKTLEMSQRFQKVVFDWQRGKEYP